MAIRVRFTGESLCEWKAPSVTAKAIKSIGKPGQELSFNVTVKHNSVLCGGRTAELRVTNLPKGWAATVNKKKSATAVIVSGQTQTFVVRLTSPKKTKYQKFTATVEARMVKKPTLKSTAKLTSLIRR
jgi:hypothetical protein